MSDDTTPKLRKVSPSKWEPFPVPDGTLVQATARKSGDQAQSITVYLDGAEIGKLETSMFTERVNYAGKRYGYDLKPRRVWYQPDHHRLKYNSLARAVLEVIRDHKASKEAGDQ